MIEVRNRVGHVRLPILAETDMGEVAYYVQPKRRTFMGITGGDSMETDEAEDRQTAFSPSGRPWMPNVRDHRLSCFLPGPQGAGKSYLARRLIDMFPSDYDVLLFTALEEPDGNFKDMDKKVWKIKLDPTKLRELTLSKIRSECKHAILLFDDIDKIRDSKVSNAVYAILNDALVNGRGHTAHDGTGDLHIIITAHALNDYQKTKYAFENSDFVGLFPQSTAPLQLQLIFKKMGLPPELCDEVIRLGKKEGVRNVIVHKSAPMYLIAEDIIHLL